LFILAAFVAIVLMAVGLFAVSKGDTFMMVALLVVLLLVVFVVAPQVPLVMAQMQHTIDAKVPLALH